MLQPLPLNAASSAKSSGIHRSNSSSWGTASAASAHTGLARDGRRLAGGGVIG